MGIRIAGDHRTLQRPGVVAPVGQGVAASVPQHVGMGLEAELRLKPCPLDHASEARTA
jgi:hypothetical protein